jgi:hypothetical protein
MIIVFWCNLNSTTIGTVLRTLWTVVEIVDLMSSHVQPYCHPTTTPLARHIVVLTSVNVISQQFNTIRVVAAGMRTSFDVELAVGVNLEPNLGLLTSHILTLQQHCVDLFFQLEPFHNSCVRSKTCWTRTSTTVLNALNAFMTESVFTRLAVTHKHDRLVQDPLAKLTDVGSLGWLMK